MTKVFDDVQESTTTTGTGNITLAGASENGRTFTSQYATNDRFPYKIDDGAGEWETGIGYLSASTTLVREYPTDGSASTPVSFSAGTKQVFVPSIKYTLPFQIPDMPAAALNNRAVKSGHIITTTTFTAVSNRLYGMPFKMEFGGIVDGLGCYVSTASGTSSNKIHLSLNHWKDDGEPGAKILSVVDLDPSTTGFKEGSVTSQYIPPGWYWACFWADTGVGVRATSSNPTELTGIEMNNSFISGNHIHSTSLQPSLTVIPDNPSLGTAKITASPVVVLGVP